MSKVKFPFLPDDFAICEEAVFECETYSLFTAFNEPGDLKTVLSVADDLPIEQKNSIKDSMTQWMSIDSPYLVPVRDVSSDEGIFYLIDAQFPVEDCAEFFLKRFMLCSINAVDVLARNNMVYGCLTKDSFVYSKGRFLLSPIGFWFRVILDSPYSPPELLEGKLIVGKSDVYSYIKMIKDIFGHKRPIKAMPYWLNYFFNYWEGKEPIDRPMPEDVLSKLCEISELEITEYMRILELEAMFYDENAPLNKRQNAVRELICNYLLQISFEYRKLLNDERFVFTVFLALQENWKNIPAMEIFHFIKQYPNCAEGLVRGLIAHALENQTHWAGDVLCEMLYDGNYLDIITPYVGQKYFSTGMGEVLEIKKNYYGNCYDDDYHVCRSMVRKMLPDAYISPKSEEELYFTDNLDD